MVLPERSPDIPPSLSLADLQAWFGAAIATPLPGRYAGNPLAVSSPALAAEAGIHLRAKGELGGFDRLGVYNEQYWFRLVSVMQADYTAVIHLMGLDAFNAWAVKYLIAHPPASPFLADLDRDFPAFLAEGYAGAQREAVVQAAAYERALSRAFDAPEGKTVAQAGLGPEAMASQRLSLAPHVSLVRCDWDFAEYRSRCLADESLEASLEPPLPASADWVIFRDADLQVLKVEEAPEAWIVLGQFPGTLEEVFARLEGRLDAAGQARLEANLGIWFQSWVSRGWLCLDERLSSRNAG